MGKTDRCRYLTDTCDLDAVGYEFLVAHHSRNEEQLSGCSSSEHTDGLPTVAVSTYVHVFEASNSKSIRQVQRTTQDSVFSKVFEVRRA